MTAQLIGESGEEMKKFFTIVLFCGLLALTLAGCGCSDDNLSKPKEEKSDITSASQVDLQEKSTSNIFDDKVNSQSKVDSASKSDEQAKATQGANITPSMTIVEKNPHSSSRVTSSTNSSSSKASSTKSSKPSSSIGENSENDNKNDMHGDVIEFPVVTLD